jgi:hypothetical protein
MSTQSGQQRHVKIEVVHEPVHIRAAVSAEHLSKSLSVRTLIDW